jgi:hypothetical protein
MICDASCLGDVDTLCLDAVTGLVDESCVTEELDNIVYDYEDVLLDETMDDVLE